MPYLSNYPFYLIIFLKSYCCLFVLDLRFWSHVWVIIVILIKSFCSLFVLNLGFSSSWGLSFLFIVIVQNNYNNEINTYKERDTANLHTL